ncbi:unnamed protein product [Penicillium salamii]|uniref:Uncharacterized protein n=1 Tax=Penicillium salamii TaxID=1612424 RepID=A0A9W4IDH1_9EURO|nr:unnamed protein product [Penicillium salamii]
MSPPASVQPPSTPFRHCLMGVPLPPIPASLNHHHMMSPPDSVQPRPFSYTTSYPSQRISPCYDYGNELHSLVPTSLSPDIHAPTVPPPSSLPTSYLPSSTSSLPRDFLTRGEWLIRQADEANPYRVRTEEERARSRSPRLTDGLQIPHGLYQGMLPEYQYQFGSTNQLSHPATHAPITPRSSERGRHQIRGYEPEENIVQTTETVPHGQESHNELRHSEDLAAVSRSPSYVIDGGLEECEEEEEYLQCEFAAPCRMDASPDGLHFRKVVSHVFGRNKAVTKIFPPEVWVHYCRKHYQRARYRADQWPFTQCDLLMESLRRMEEWNGVVDFELTLRRRERIRVAEATNDKSGRKEAPKSENRALKPIRPGRKHPTAIVAPAPDWLRSCTGEHLSFDAIRAIIERIRKYMTALRAREKEQQAQQEDPFKNTSSTDKSKSSLAIRNPAKRQSQKTHPYKLRPTPSMVRFPDIEILPNFQTWVREAALRQRSATAPVLGNSKDKKKGKSGLAVQTRTVAQSPRCRLQTAAIPFRPRQIPESTEAHGTSSVSATTPCGRRGTIGRAGTNRGNSASQQRRSDRVFQQALDRLPRRGRKTDSHKGETKPISRRGEDPDLE